MTMMGVKAETLRRPAEKMKAETHWKLAAKVKTKAESFWRLVAKMKAETSRRPNCLAGFSLGADGG